MSDGVGAQSEWARERESLAGEQGKALNEALQKVRTR
jgi:hypothetical protein